MEKLQEVLNVTTLKEDHPKKSLITQFKDKFINVAQKEKQDKLNLLLDIYEEKRISKEEYLSLVSGIGDQKMVIESITIDNSVKVQTGTTWGGVNVGDNNSSDSSYRDRDFGIREERVDSRFNVSRR